VQVNARKCAVEDQSIPRLANSTISRPAHSLFSLERDPRREVSSISAAAESLAQRWLRSRWRALTFSAMSSCSVQFLSPLHCIIRRLRWREHDSRAVRGRRRQECLSKLGGDQALELRPPNSILSRIVQNQRKFRPRSETHRGEMRRSSHLRTATIRLCY
jgi:hypothetical protein